eukprot:6214208-Pleurochrysis_carterae.AAC.8
MSKAERRVGGGGARVDRQRRAVPACPKSTLRHFLEIRVSGIGVPCLSAQIEQLRLMRAEGKGDGQHGTGAERKRRTRAPRGKPGSQAVVIGITERGEIVSRVACVSAGCAAHGRGRGGEVRTPTSEWRRRSRAACGTRGQG